MNDQINLRVRFHYFDGYENAPALRAFLALGFPVLRTIGPEEKILQHRLVDPRWRRLVAAEWHPRDLHITDLWLALRSEGNIQILEERNVP